jgi:HK97 family phage major capsid protein
MQVKEKELKTELEFVLKSARDTAAKAEAENRDFSAEEMAAVKQSLDRAKSIKDELKPFAESAELKSLLQGFGPAHAETPEGPVSSEQIEASAKSGSVGRQFVEAPEFKSWLQSIARPDGSISDSVKGIKSPPLHYSGSLKALITGASDTSGGAFVQSDFRGLQDAGAFMRPLTIRDIVTTIPTTSDTVEYVRQGTPTNAAAPTAEATTAAGPTQDGTTGPLIQAAGGGYKPESTMVLSRVTDTIKTIAHWMPATKRALADAPQIRALIDEFLRYGLEEELEDQMVTGDGTGENFTGLSNVSGIQVHALGADTRIAAARKARTKVLTVGRARPNAYIMNPLDWEEYDLAVDNETRYYFGGPMALGTPRLWGLPVIESEAVPAGTAYVGDFTKCVLYDREQATVSVSDSHADFFVRNLIAILAELRAGFGVLRPSAIVRITGI